MRGTQSIHIGARRALSLLALALLLCGGCRDRDRTLFSESDTLRREFFPQNDPSTADILWVVDSSCSMADEQADLAANFPSFIDIFLERQLDFQIAVTSTNIDEEGTEGLDGRMVGEPPIITQDDEDVQSAFVERALLGIDPGHQDEKGLEAAYRAIEVLGSGPNAGFLRPQAHLAVIIVSDEPDYSERDAPGSDEITDWAAFSTWLDGLKGPTGQRQTDLSAIVGVSDDGFEEPGWCGLEEGQSPQDGNGAVRGDGYLEAAVATGGLWASICEEDWGELLGRVGLRAAGLLDSWQLLELPLEGTLQVWVDGLRPGDAVWEYFPTDNSVRFLTWEAIPRPGQVVEVQYEVADPEEE